MGTPSTSRQGSRALLQTTSSSSITITEPQDETDRRVEPPVLKLRLHKPKNDKKVKWTAGTVDNEGMDKKKSKCCCIYVKPREFGESSSESEDECEHCYGHVEHKKKKKPPGKDPPSPDDKPANDDEPK